MISAPLVYQAARQAVFGQCWEYDTGSITDALFVYLDGVPSAESIRAVDEDYRCGPIVCLSAAWENHIRKHYPEAHIFQRYMMKPSCRFTLSSSTLPEGFRVALFDEKAFALHPFSHGENYPSFDGFCQYGAGAVVWHNDKIVASASSFISLDNEIELDVSTEEQYWGRGLATACISLMLQECVRKGLTVHWDAQNDTSRHLAEKFGFELECCYPVYFLPG